MRLKDLINATKKITDGGKWTTGKMPASAFPLSRSGKKSYRLGGSWEWTVVKFESGDEMYRLLIGINLAKEQYQATLGQENDGDMKVLASYEFHGTHPGWHVHSVCGDISNVPVGRYKGDWKKRIPKGRKFHRKQGFGVKKENALSIAYEFFGLYKNDNSQVELLS